MHKAINQCPLKIGQVMTVKSRERFGRRELRIEWGCEVPREDFVIIEDVVLFNFRLGQCGVDLCDRSI